MKYVIFVYDYRHHQRLIITKIKNIIKKIKLRKCKLDNKEIAIKKNSEP